MLFKCKLVNLRDRARKYGFLRSDFIHRNVIAVIVHASSTSSGSQVVYGIAPPTVRFILGTNGMAFARSIIAG